MVVSTFRKWGMEVAYMGILVTPLSANLTICTKGISPLPGACDNADTSVFNMIGLKFPIFIKKNRQHPRECI